MKRIGFIYEKIYEIENIKKAILKASINKRKRKNVQRILNNIDFYALEISNMLCENRYIPSDFTTTVITDGIHKKSRTIFKQKFYPDQIIQWAILLQLRPIIMRGMYQYSCGSVPSRGLYYGQKYIKAIVQHKFKASKYFLQFDVHKFYPSVDNEILIEMLRRKIKDERLLLLIKAILDKGIGLPIGTLLSQWFSNFYLEGLDHYIKEKLGVKYYMRYVDDGLVFWHNKKQLHKMKDEITAYLATIGLTLKANWKVCRTDVGIDILGMRFFRDRTILRKSVMLRITRKVKRVYKRKTYHAHNCMSILSYFGWLKHSDSFELYTEWVKPYTNLRKMKAIVKKYMKEKNCIGTVSSTS